MVDYVLTFLLLLITTVSHGFEKKELHQQIHLLNHEVSMYCRGNGVKIQVGYYFIIYYLTFSYQYPSIHCN